MAQSATDIETLNKATIKASFDAWRNGTGGPFDLQRIDPALAADR